MKYSKSILILTLVLIAFSVFLLLQPAIMDFTGRATDQATTSVTVTGDAYPNVYLISPADATSTTTTSHNFTCNTTDDFILENVTLFVWKSGAAYYNNTTTISGTANSSSWSLTSMPIGSYTWNCLTYDNTSQSKWGSSNYTLIVNTAGTAPSGSSISGRNTGGFSLVSPPFSVNPSVITSKLMQGQAKSYDILVNANEDVEVTITVEDIDEFVILEKEKHSLLAGESGYLKLDLFTLSTTKPGVYIGKLRLTSGTYEKSINIIIEVWEQESLFDMKVTVLPGYKQIRPGDEVWSTLNLKNVGLHGKAVDVAIQYSIKSYDNETIYQRSEKVVAVTTELSVLEKIPTQKNIPIGSYLIIVKAKYGNVTMYSHDSFEIIPQEIYLLYSNISWVLVIILLTLIAFLIIYYNRHGKRFYKRKKKVLITDYKINKKKRKSKKIL